jgi:hypothetical protein
VGRKGIILYNLLRPELVKANDTPLSSGTHAQIAAQNVVSCLTPCIAA